MLGWVARIIRYYDICCVWFLIYAEGEVFCIPMYCDIQEVNTVKPVLNGLSRDQKIFPLKAVSA